VTCAAGGLLAVATIRNPDGAVILAQLAVQQFGRAVDGTPLQPSPTADQAA
jgi:hypothetical protein